MSSVRRWGHKKPESHVFARKLIRVLGEVTNEDIEREVDVIESLCAFPKHDNLLEIFGHGWLAGTSSMYYIDMELCVYNLEDYIKVENISVLESIPPKQPTAKLFKALKRMMGILQQISNGLSYIHNKSQVHGDLKPTNGMIFNYML